MLTTHKAIQTRYKGYRFRSRLEARWAVFFDACDTEWQYEPQGYDLSYLQETLGCFHSSDVGLYLPDFYLPKLDQWVEIKPCLPPEHFGCTLEEDKICALVRHTEAANGFVLWGIPDFDVPLSMTNLNPDDYDCSDWAVVSRFTNASLGCLMDPFVAIKACEFAKSARFEFGESGAQ